MTQEDNQSGMNKEFREKVGFILTSITATLAVVAAFIGVLYSTGEIDLSTAKQKLQNLRLHSDSLPAVDTIWANQKCSKIQTQSGESGLNRYNYNATYRAKNIGELLYHIQRVNFAIYGVPMVTDEEHQDEQITIRFLNDEINEPKNLIPGSAKSVTVDESFSKSNWMDVSFNFDVSQKAKHNYYLVAEAQGGLPTISENSDGKLGTKDREGNVEYAMLIGERDLRLVEPLNCGADNANWTKAASDQE